MNIFEIYERYPLRELKNLEFTVYTSDEIRKKSHVVISVPNTYDEQGIVIENGVIDLRLGVTSENQTCSTCGGNFITCQGHNGHIELVMPVCHIEYAKYIALFLSITCKHCFRLMTTLAKVTVTVCPYCEKSVPKYTHIKPLAYYEDEVKLTALEIRERFEKILDSDLAALKYIKNVRPENFILTALLVTSVKTRPSVILDKGKRSENDLTHKLIDILRINQKIIKLKETGAIENVISNLYNLLEYHVATYFNNSIPNLPASKHRTGKVLVSVADRLKGKGGRFRLTLAGKRVDFVGRSVISPDLTIQINEISLPLEFAKGLTKPQKVTARNIDQIIALLNNWPNYPSVQYVYKQNRKIRVLETNKEALLESIELNATVERNIMNKDVVLVNRQPSLHKLSILAHTVVVKDQKTIGIHPVACKGYNGDFDGDEMNIHVPQTIEAEVEAKELLLFSKNLILNKTGNICYGLIKDILLGLYLLLDAKDLTPKQIVSLAYNLNIPINLLNGKNGKEIIEFLLPRNLNYKQKISSGMLEIVDSKIISGRLEKSSVGIEGKLLTYVLKYYGEDEAYKLLNNLSILGLNAISTFGYTYALNDFVISQEFTKTLESEISKTIHDYSEGQSANKALTNLRNTITDLAEKSFANEPNYILAKSGAAGTVVNFIQNNAFLGLQRFNVSILRKPFKGKKYAVKRSIPETLNELDFIDSSFTKGLTELEYYDHATSARDSLIDVNIKTSNCGYIQRKLTNCLQDLVVRSDLSIRDAQNRIIQLKAGYDGLDCAKISTISPEVNLSLFEFSQKLKTSDTVTNKETDISGYPQTFTKGVITFLNNNNINYLDNKALIDANLNEVYEEHCVAVGEPIGLIVSQNLGEPTTQMNLNEKHTATELRALSISGLDRLTELFNVSDSLKAPISIIEIDNNEYKNFIDVITPIYLPDLADLNIDFENYCIIVSVNRDLQAVIAKLKISVTYTIEIADNIIRVRPNGNVKNYVILSQIYDKLVKLLVKGVKNIRQMHEEKGIQKTKVTILGADLKEILKAKKLFDFTVYNNQVYDIYKIYGISTAKYYLVKEIYDTYASQGLNIAIRHIHVLVNLMCFNGTILPVTREGIVKLKSSVLGKASFETANKVLVSASVRNEVDNLSGLFENTLVGKNINAGTNIFKLNYEADKT